MILRVGARMARNAAATLMADLSLVFSLHGNVEISAEGESQGLQMWQLIATRCTSPPLARKNNSTNTELTSDAGFNGLTKWCLR